jgi:hypothetical protein
MSTRIEGAAALITGANLSGDLTSIYRDLAAAAAA